MGQFLANPKFNKAWKDAGGTAAELYHGSNGPWAKASGRFVADTVGEVRLLGFNASERSVFVNTELKTALLDSSRITSIEGISTAELKSMRFGDRVNALKQSSLLHAGTSGFKVAADGSVTVGDFLKSDVLDAEAYAKAHPEAAQNYKEFWKESFTFEERRKLKPITRGLGKAALLGHGLGVAMGLLQFYTASAESAEAVESGDTEKARKIMDAWAIDAAGSAVGVTIGGADDTLDGLAGDDVLRGGAGNDTLNRGAGSDQLVGGDDVLIGGKGSDQLQGGKGNDTYRFSAGDGVDVIRDEDGQGSIEADGQTLTGGKKLADGAWISDDKQFTFTLVSDGFTQQRQAVNQDQWRTAA